MNALTVPSQDGLTDLYPFQSNYFDIGQHKMHYVDEGQGPTLVMLHGNPTWSFYYRELIKGLRDRFRVIVPDHMGCGLSDKPQEYAYTLTSHIDNVSRLLQHLRVQDVTLVLHDWGGAIGFGWARRHVSCVKRFVLFNTAAFLGPCPWRIRLCRMPIMGSLAVRGLNAFALGAVYMACKDRTRMTARVRAGYLLPYNNFANRVAVDRFIRDIPLHPGATSRNEIEAIDDSLGQFRDRPMLICWGGRDFCFNDGYLTKWQQKFPDAEVHHFPDAGHYVVEDALSEILPLMNRFLENDLTGERA